MTLLPDAALAANLDPATRRSDDAVTLVTASRSTSLKLWINAEGFGTSGRLDSPPL
ncbi:hypothetical protein ACFQS1_12955 [Paractinoplanes rhizophilus]|uniref:Uncharacterized protein n=1 Tax=Paractinoplanes rhizophilus TaxID=1416877 RepID=A0ABW2HNU9_9ACTN